MFSGIRAPAWHGGFRISRLLLTRVWRNTCKLYVVMIGCYPGSLSYLDFKEETLSEDSLDYPPKTEPD